MLFHIYSTLYIQWHADKKTNADDHIHLQPDTKTLQTICVSEFIDSRPPSEAGASQASIQGWNFGSLTEAYRFDKAAGDLATTNRRPGLVFTIKYDSGYMPKSLFLIGCHLILSHSLGFEETCLSLKRFPGYADGGLGEVCLATGLRSFCCAKCLDWISCTAPPQCINSSAPALSEITKKLHVDGCVLNLACSSTSNKKKTSVLSHPTMHT